MKILHTEKLTLRGFNNILTVVVIFLGMYIMFSPYLPAINWWVKHEAPVISKPATPPLSSGVVLDINSLVIPRLEMQELVHAGPSATELNKGVWLRPNTSTPNKGSNTVLAGHRFTHSGHDVFYHLDKIQIGDLIELHWNKKRYTYRVQNIRTVPPTAIEIEAPTTKPQLTLYTCTPLWSAKNRLVLTATLEEKT
jgi:LPXTG-site transpeptidase (sortase) family protein